MLPKSTLLGKVDADKLVSRFSSMNALLNTPACPASGVLRRSAADDDSATVVNLLDTQSRTLQ
eukprot:4066304-Prorocentrum_lima.AAC.1